MWVRIPLELHFMKNHKYIKPSMKTVCLTNRISICQASGYGKPPYEDFHHHGHHRPHHWHDDRPRFDNETHCPPMWIDETSETESE